eukprot:818563-Prymnesium_polylepis.2
MRIAFRWSIIVYASVKLTSHLSASAACTSDTPSRRRTRRRAHAEACRWGESEAWPRVCTTAIEGSRRLRRVRPAPFDQRLLEAIELGSLARLLPLLVSGLGRLESELTHGVALLARSCGGRRRAAMGPHTTDRHGHRHGSPAQARVQRGRAAHSLVVAPQVTLRHTHTLCRGGFLVPRGVSSGPPNHLSKRGCPLPSAPGCPSAPT